MIMELETATYWCARNSDGVMPVADRKARVKALWSQKPQACAISATERPGSRSILDAAAIRNFVMNWLGVRPKSRLMRRANRCDGSFERRASQAGVTSAERLCSNSPRALAKSAGISSCSTGIRMSRENPIRPTTVPPESKIGSFVVRHQTGSLGRCHCSSRWSTSARPVRKTLSSCSVGILPKSPRQMSRGHFPITCDLLFNPWRATSDSFTATYRPTASFRKKATSGDWSKSFSNNATSTDATGEFSADLTWFVRGFMLRRGSGPGKL